MPEIKKMRLGSFANLSRNKKNGLFFGLDRLIMMSPGMLPSIEKGNQEEKEVITMNVRKTLAAFVLMAMTVSSLVLITPAAQAEARWWTYSNNGNSLRQSSIFSSDRDFNTLSNRISHNNLIYSNRYSMFGNENNRTYYRATNNRNYRWIRSSLPMTRVIADRDFYNRMNFYNRYNFINTMPSQLYARNMYFYDSSDPNSVIYMQNVLAGNDSLNQAYVMMSRADFLSLMSAVDGRCNLDLSLNAANRTVQFYTPTGSYRANNATMSFY